MAGHVEKLGRAIESTIKNYNGFVGSLERQVLPTARKLQKLDESTVLGPLAAIEDAPRELTAMELVAELESAGLDSAVPTAPELQFTALDAARAPE